MANSDILAAALDWAKKGVPVFPCGMNKAPLTARGHLDATTNPEEVRFLFEGVGDCMIGARMGKDSGLFALDFDLYKAGASDYMNYLSDKGLLNDTQVHTTQSGGLHVLYRGDGEYPNVKPHTGVEVKGEGGYIIVPPSHGYAIQKRGIAYARPELIKELRAKKAESSSATVDSLKRRVLSGDSFHDPLAQIAARRSAQGWTIEAVQKEIYEILDASAARVTTHPRHARWQSLMADEGKELTRIVGTGHDKYNSNAQTEKVKERVDADTHSRLHMAGASIFQRSEDDDSTSDQSGSAQPELPDWGVTEWPFETSGYFSTAERDIFDQAYVAYPLFAERESVLIAAEPKAGKTAIALKLGMQVAYGEDMGNDFKVSDARPVLYFSLEGARAVEMRIRAELDDRKDRGLAQPERDMLFVVDRPHNFATPEVRDSNGAKIVLHNEMCKREFGTELGLIVIDTLTKAMPGRDQNSVEDTSELFELIGFLRTHGVNATVVFIHHLSKQGNVRGSTNIEAEVDVVLGVSKDRKTGLVYMDVRRARSMDEDIRYAFQFDSHHLGTTKQGHDLHAPIVRLVGDHIPAAGVNAAIAAKFAKVMDAVVTLGKGHHDIAVLVGVLQKVVVIQVPQVRRPNYFTKTIQDAVRDALMNQMNITYGNWIVRLQTNPDDHITGVSILHAT